MLLLLLPLALIDILFALAMLCFSAILVAVRWMHFEEWREEASAMEVQLQKEQVSCDTYSVSTQK